MARWANPFTLAGQLTRARQETARIRHESEEDFWALKDVNFEIRRGERVGIIGRNGAGKSTLLKILSRITEPTTGRVELRGRVASLLEVGTGFHPELTGRENIYLNGAILGMTRREIRLKFDEIVDFSEVEKFLDTPVKRYSSGMYVRLAFAVAAHLEPEILIVDEVLAVGDGQFQQKCISKMQDISRQSLRTVIFVSHNMSAISTLCSKGILLDGGMLSHQGSISKAIDGYVFGAKDSLGSGTTRWSANQTAYVKRVFLRDLAGREMHELDAASPPGISLCFEIVNTSEKDLRLGFTIYNQEGIGVFSAISTDAIEAIPTGNHELAILINTNLLNPGIFRVEGALSAPSGVIDADESYTCFNVVSSSPFDLSGFKSKGLLRIRSGWALNQDQTLNS